MTKTFRIILLAILPMFLFSQEEMDIRLDSLDRYFTQALEDWNVPGMAIAIVQDDSIIFDKGYGNANLDTEAPVDANTLFAVASNTKAFTSAALAILVDQGKVSWDDPVKKYLPWFQLYDPYVSENFTIRDLLTHRSGLRTFSGDLIWYGTKYSRKEVVEKAKFLEPAYTFREKYGYSNIMYIAAGLIVEEVSGMSWDAFIKEYLLEPLNMARTISSTKDLDQLVNISAPHNDVNDSLFTIEWLNWDNVAPAGGLISSVNDMSQWLIFQLNRGITKNGDTLISFDRFREMWAPQTVQDVSPWFERMWPSTHFKSYGLGWSIMDYHGRKVLGHGGGYDGFISNTTFVPEEDLGFVILTNKNTSLYYPLRFKILDVFLDGEEQKDWSAEMLNLIRMSKEREKEARKKDEEGREKNTTPTLPVEEYLGTYTSLMYGEAEVYMDGEQMMVKLMPTEIFNGELTHWQYNTWEIEFKSVPSLPKGKVNFIINADGEVEEMQIDVPNPDFDFTELEFRR